MTLAASRGVTDLYPSYCSLCQTSMTANVIGGTFTAPQGVRTLTSIGTVLWVTDTVAPVAVRAARGPFSSGICGTAPPKLEDMRDSNPTPIDVRADPESRNTRAMKDPTDPGNERSARKHSAL